MSDCKVATIYSTINSMAKVVKTLRSRIDLNFILDQHAYETSSRSEEYWHSLGTECDSEPFRSVTEEFVASMSNSNHRISDVWSYLCSDTTSLHIFMCTGS